MSSPIHVLRQFWSYESFRPMQEAVIRSIMDNRDTLALLPTGGGKSVCFQIPALLKEGICIVVSPLIALMKDQTENLKKRGIKALAIYSGMSSGEIDATLDNAVYGNYKLLYLSPERLRTEIFRVRLQKMNVSFLVVDEAHCISQWGYDFRPDYLLIKELLTITGPIPVVALTASATPKVAIDIMDKLGFKEHNLIKSGFERENLAYIVKQTEDKNGQLLRIVKAVKGSGIVYVSQRKRAEELASFLVSQSIAADSYHAGYSADLRSKKQDDWKNGDISVIVSTNAFGMGIDKPDVRFVCHFDIPESLEAYFQEAGRAGRDGNKAYAVLLWNNSDIKRLNQIVTLSFPKIEYIKDIYQKLYRFFDYAYGSGKGDAVRFNITEFCSKYRINASSVYYAIKHLESEDYLKLTEELYNPSRIMFLVNRDELYNVQLKNESLDSFIKSILRLYTGLFSEYTSIDEDFIARAIRNSKAAVVATLIRLSRMGILAYIPGAHSPLLIFNFERLQEEGMVISEQNYRQKRERLQERINSVVEYASDKESCRSVYLVKYFGQSDAAMCGICDVCLALKSKKRDDKELEIEIIDILTKSPVEIKTLINLYEQENIKIVDLLRDMVQREVLYVDSDMVYLSKKSR